MLKGAGGLEMLRALRAVASGEAIFGATVARRIVGQMAEGRDADVPFGLTGREPEILELIARGLTNDAIAKRLFLGSKTNRNYVCAIFTKLDASSRAEAVATARDAGFGGRDADDR